MQQVDPTGQQVDAFRQNITTGKRSVLIMIGLLSVGRCCSLKLIGFRSAGIGRTIPNSVGNHMQEFSSSRTSDKAQPVKAIYTDETPLKLIRVNKGPSIKVRLRSKASKQNPHATDVSISGDGLIRPIEGQQRRRNGMMMIAPNPVFLPEYLDLMGRKCTVLEIPKGTPIPDGLVLHRRSPEIYSLEPSEPCTPRELNKMLSEFVAPHKAYSKVEYLNNIVN